VVAQSLIWVELEGSIFIEDSDLRGAARPASEPHDEGVILGAPSGAEEPVEHVISLAESDESRLVVLAKEGIVVSSSEESTKGRREEDSLEH